MEDVIYLAYNNIILVAVYYNSYITCNCTR